MGRNSLEHRLPWSSLAEIVKYRSQGHKIDAKQVKRVLHFSRCLFAAIEEFAATTKSSDEIKRRYDPETWGIDAVTSSPFDVAYYDSILDGYVELNLVLFKPSVFMPIVMGDSLHATKVMDAMRGAHSQDSNHPEWIASQLQQAFDGRHMKPLTDDVLQTLRDHCDHLFRCMFSLVKPRGRLDANFIASSIGSRFGFYWEIDALIIQQSSEAAA